MRDIIASLVISGIILVVSIKGFNQDPDLFSFLTFLFVTQILIKVLDNRENIW